MSPQLRYLSDKSLEEWRQAIPSRLSRYRGDGFEDLADEPGASISLGISYDATLLASVRSQRERGAAADDLVNSRIVGKALEGLSPSLANEERVWVRLTHVELFQYARSRWMADEADDKLEETVRTHMFASTQTGIRDDNAVSRLWWNYRVAKLSSPDDVDGALALILKTADIRSNFVERIWMTSRRPIAGAVLRTMKHDGWVTETERSFRDFMKAVNQLGGGLVFEAMEPAEVDEFVCGCARFAREVLAAA